MVNKPLQLVVCLSAAIFATVKAQTQYVCPSVGSAPNELTMPTGVVEITTPTGEGLCTLTAIDSFGNLIPIARSYDGLDWELTPGKYVTQLEFDCSGGGSCTVDLSSVSETQLHLTSFEPYLVSSDTNDQKAIVARFLQTATFGPTKEDIEDWDYGSFQDSFKDWVSDQIDPTITTPSIHREFFRERANPRWERDTFVGRPRGPSPCSKDSRWRNFAFTVKDQIDDVDERKVFRVTDLQSDLSGIGPYLLSIDGHPRTIVESYDLEADAVTAGVSIQLDTDYLICYDKHRYWQESFGEYFSLDFGSGVCCDLALGNPLIDIDGIEDQVTVVDLEGANLDSIDDTVYNSQYWTSFQAGDEFILTADHDDASCDALPEDPWNTNDPNDVSTFPIAPIFGKRQVLHNNVLTTQYLLWDPRLELFENTIENPLPDGGGSTSINSDGEVYCANAPRTFLNEDHCYLSEETTACSALTPPTFSIQLNDDFLHNGLNTLITDPTSRTVYSFVDMPFPDAGAGDTITNDDQPCNDWDTVYSRWMQVDAALCSGDPLTWQSVGSETAAIYEHLLSPAFDDEVNPSPLLKDVRRFYYQFCDDADEAKLDLGLILSHGTCWRHVNRQYGNIYDVTYWYENSGSITDWYELADYKKAGGAQAIIDWSTTARTLQDFLATFHNDQVRYPFIGKLDDTLPYEDLDEIYRADGVREAYGETHINPAGKGVVICGSLGEVANDPTKGSAFDINSGGNTILDTETTRSNLFTAQRATVWSYLALTANDQLRQRMAFALSQILVVSNTGTNDRTNTETILQYYDIFVRNAFGSYRDILKQVSFSHSMGAMLSSVDNKSYQYLIDRGEPPAYPDENFAREILQLFSVGLIHLNIDGTPQRDAMGELIETYDSDDVLSYSRAWTGFDQQDRRGNNDARTLRVDPMDLRGDWHDIFPKTDLLGGYVGDRYPLCADLPKKHHLHAGATYRLLGSKSVPDWLEDPSQFDDIPGIRRLELDSQSGNSPLYDVLCDDQGSGCTFPGKVVLDSPLDYSGAAATNVEYANIDTIRSVQVRGGTNPIYYEYIRQPCVEQSFYANARKVQDTESNAYVVQNSMCANPLTEVAMEICCDAGWEAALPDLLAHIENISGSDENTHGHLFCAYNGERVSFKSAEDRCSTNGEEQCTPLRLKGGAGVCASYRNKMFSWTTKSCSIQAKIDANGNVAIVHDPEADYTGVTNVVNRVDANTQNYFKVAWDEDTGPGKPTPTNEAECLAIDSSVCMYYDDACICDTTLIEAAASSSVLSRDVILSTLFIGAPNAALYTDTYTSLDCGESGVDVYIKNGGTAADCNTLDTDSVFAVTDDNGIQRFIKNMKSDVEIATSGYKFRNPVQFSSLVDPELRDAHHEIDAVIDTFFYHPTHAPFLAHRLIQRFGNSNPSPKLVEAVATAYKTGNYMGIGTGKYGDLGALVAAIILEPETTSVAITSDPTYGQLREPLVKVVGFLRGMDYNHDSPLTFPLLAELQAKIGQGPYGQPHVFSFFLPEFVPTGPIGGAHLVSPEAQVMSGNKIVELLDGLFTTVKNGLISCNGGLQDYTPGNMGCGKDDGDKSRSYGVLDYAPPGSTVDDMLNDLSLMLTSSRLAADNHDYIKNFIDAEFTSGDKDKALRIAQQLIAATPAFHSSNLSQNSDVPREKEEETNVSDEPYRAVIFLMFDGGMNSWNMVVPKENCGTSPAGLDIYDEYRTVRGDQQALAKSDLIDISASGSNQPCNTFGVNSKFPIAASLYSAGEAMFFANTGVLEVPVNKYNYEGINTRLFAHNHQQREVMRLDIEEEMGESGVGGRMLDALRQNGYKTSANTVDQSAILASGSPAINNPVRELSSGSLREFNRYSSDAGMNDAIRALNGVADKTENSIFGETWSTRLIQALDENAELKAIQDNDNFDVPDFNDDESRLDRRFKAVASYMKARNDRNVNREVFVINDGGYDHHAVDADNNLETKLENVNRALEGFKAEMESQGLWDDVVIVTGSDFGRTLTANSGGGTDHAWGGHYVMLGGNVNGAKIMGEYPNDLNEQTSDLVMKRGRVVPTTPYDSIWNGVAQWMGITEEADLDYILPNRHNFPRCSLFTDMDLFTNGVFEHDAWCNQVVQPTDPTASPSLSSEPSTLPSSAPSPSSMSPSMQPSSSPSMAPSATPSLSHEPSIFPSITPSESQEPSSAPSIRPSMSPSSSPSSAPSSAPSMAPSFAPSNAPSSSPSTASPSISLSPSGPVCSDSPTDDWYYIKKDKKKDCEEVAKDPNKRCDKEKSEDGTMAWEACQLSCGICTNPPTVAPTGAPSISGSPTTELQGSGGGDFCAALAADETNHCGEEKDGEPKVMMCYHNTKKGHVKSKCESVSDIEEKYNDPTDKMMLHCGCCLVPTEISAEEQDDKHCSITPNRKKQRKLNLRPRGE